ncbi:MAG: CBS domain-containing protein [Deltaproteobacteria bacterium]|nr:CBS domain-containing protein [Deltaproteobacteria bacterium]
MKLKFVSDVMTRKLYTVTPDADIKSIHEIMQKKCVQHLLVSGKSGELLGMISDRDIKKYISPFVGSGAETSKDRATLNLRAATIMAKNIIVAHPEDSLKHCTETMLSKSIHALPIVEKQGDRLVGLVTTTDLLRVLLSIL